MRQFFRIGNAQITILTKTLLTFLEKAVYKFFCKVEYLFNIFKQLLWRMPPQQLENTGYMSSLLLTTYVYKFCLCTVYCILYSIVNFFLQKKILPWEIWEDGRTGRGRIYVLFIIVWGLTTFYVFNQFLILISMVVVRVSPIPSLGKVI